MIARAALLVGIVAVAVTCAYTLSARGESLYGAHAEVLFSSPAAASGNDGPRVMATQRSLMLSDAILADVAAEARVPLADLRRRATVELEQDTLLRLTVADPQARRARLLARQIAERYASRVGTLARPTSEPAERYVRAELATTRRRVRAVSRRLRRLSRKDPASAPLQEDLRALLARRTALEDRLVELRVDDSATGVARVVSVTSPTGDRLSPRPRRAGVAGGLVGVLIAAAVALAFARRRSLGSGD